MLVDTSSLRAAAWEGFSAAKRAGKSDAEAQRAGKVSAAAHVEALASAGRGHLGVEGVDELLAYAARIRG